MPMSATIAEVGREPPAGLAALARPAKRVRFADQEPAPRAALPPRRDGARPSARRSGRRGARACFRSVIILAARPTTQPGAALLRLPREILERVLRKCDVRRLAALEASCRHFIAEGLAQRIAHEQLAQIPRVHSLHPRYGETWLTLLHYAQQQSTAAAQATALALGSYHTLGIFATAGCRRSYALASFGRGFHGQLGHGSFDSAATPQLHLKGTDLLIGGHADGRSAVPRPGVVACGSEHSVALSACGQLYTWGLAGSGELGRPEEGGVSAALPRPVAPWQPARMVSLAAGAHHSLAIAETGAVWACGAGGAGQLGTGTCKDSFLLQCVHLRGEPIVAVAAGEAHSIALSLDGVVWTWGSGARGQLGHPAARPATSDAARGPAACVTTPRLLMALHPAALPADRRVTAVCAGAQHTMLLTVGGALLACGGNRHGCLGLGDEADRDVPAEVPLGHLRGAAQAPPRVVQVACGRAHTLILVHCAGRTLVCATGYNFFGQLGLGDTAPRATFREVTALRGAGIVAIAAGDNHCAAVSARGRLFLWGRGDCGQLAAGSDRNRSTPAPLPGARVVHPNVTLRRRDPPAAE